MTTWKKLIEAAMAEHGEALSDLIACTLTEYEMEVSFDEGEGKPEGAAFTAWSEKFVYFPLCYDGAEWVGSVARNPNGKPTKHQGSW